MKALLSVISAYYNLRRVDFITENVSRVINSKAKLYDLNPDKCLPICKVYSSNFPTGHVAALSLD